jgi:hypothetical protein
LRTTETPAAQIEHQRAGGGLEGKDSALPAMGFEPPLPFLGNLDLG